MRPWAVQHCLRLASSRLSVVLVPFRFKPFGSRHASSKGRFCGTFSFAKKVSSQQMLQCAAVEGLARKGLCSIWFVNSGQRLGTSVPFMSMRNTVGYIEVDGEASSLHLSLGMPMSYVSCRTGREMFARPLVSYHLFFQWPWPSNCIS